ncbi:peptidase domain-containing ABC transporter [Citrobacter amalonaticus]|uniref:peptidase domain-containing ABC transporter n=1 Tax=Citrobacter amalonaticus TaxID=35703 RepID=UPI00300DADE1
MLSKLQAINFGFRGKSLPVVLQNEAAECGLACVSMVSAWYQNVLDLRQMRREHGVSQKGLTLNQLMNVARHHQLASRSLRLELSELGKLRLPCILHWDMVHFVVLKEVGSKQCVIHDPAIGRRVLSMAEVSASFTGVALELWPDKDFTPAPAPIKIKLRQLIGRVIGLKSSAGYVIALGLAIEFITLLLPLFSQWTIDDAIVSSDRHLLLVLMLGYGLTLLIKQLMSMIRAWVMIYITTAIRIQWQGSVLHHLLRLPVAFFERRHLGDLVSRFGAVDTIQSTLSSSFLVASLDGLLSVITLVMMLLYSPILTLIPVTVLVVYLAGRVCWYLPLRNASHEQIIHAAKQNTHFLETLRGVKTLKLYQKTSLRSDEWLTLLVNQLNASVRTQKLQIYYQQLNSLLFSIDNLLVLGIGASMVIDQAFTVGLLMAFISYKGQFLERVRNLVDNIFALRMLSIQTERLADIVLSEPEGSEINTTGQPSLTTAPDVEFKAISFQYAPLEPFALKDVSFNVAAGECVAIMGMSGCGKTTLGQLSLGCLQPTQGEILINGQPLEKFGVESLRAISAAVLQDDVLFAGTILDNITFGDVGDDTSFAFRCAEIAAIHQDIMAMPMKYDTLVGDMGAALSGGQKQRLFLARALYRKPFFLLLDEATSHLDIFLEKKVNDALRELRITRLMIAHRPQTLMMADKVIVMESGRVAGEKTPAELFTPKRKEAV